MPKHIAGIDLIFQIVVDKFVYHLPLYRQLQQFKQGSIDIKSSTMNSWFNLVSNHIRLLFAVHKTYILKIPIISQIAYKSSGSQHARALVQLLLIQKMYAVELHPKSDKQVYRRASNLIFTQKSNWVSL